MYVRISRQAVYIVRHNRKDIRHTEIADVKLVNKTRKRKKRDGCVRAFATGGLRLPTPAYQSRRVPCLAFVATCHMYT